MAGKRILFIDNDEAFLRNIVSAAQAQGYDTTVSGTSNEGLDLVRTERPDLVVVSVELKPTNGWSVCTRLKKDDELSYIPVILTSADSTPDTFEKHKKLKTRADEYLHKPYAADELLRIAGHLLGVPEPVSEDDLIVEGDESFVGEDYASGADEAIEVSSDEPMANGNGLAADSANDEDLMIEGPAQELEEDPIVEASGTELHLESDALVLPSDSDAGAEESLMEDIGLELPSDNEELVLEERTGGKPSTAVDLPIASAEDGDIGEALDPLGQGEVSLQPGSFDDLAAQVEQSMPPPAAVSNLGGEEFDEAFDRLSQPVSIKETKPESELTPPVYSSPVVTAPLPHVTPPPVIAAQPRSEQTLGDRPQNLDAMVAKPPGATVPPPLRKSEQSAIRSEADRARSAELEARVASLEAEIEGFRATEGSHEADMKTLRDDKARETQELRDQLHEKEKLIAALKDSEGRAGNDASKARDERVRREAALKSLTQKAEQMSAENQRLQQELAEATEEAQAAAEMRAKVTELEASLATAQREAGEAQKLRQQAEQHERDLDRVRAAHGQAVIDLGSLKSDLDRARSEASSAKSDADQTRAQVQQHTANVADLQKQLSAAQEQMKQLATQAEAAGDRASRHRAQLLKLAEELQLAN